jgi:beta-N-acetylhexosaminidase
VLDSHSNPANPVIGERALGRTADDVIKSMLPFAKAMERRGVRACGKHFPGHGDTQADSHHELPVIDLTLDQIKSRELKPFAAAIEGGIEMMMTSHILYRKLDPNDPVTLSRTITQGLLREAMKFDGVIVSDDVGMRAMAGRLDAPDSGALFMAAGNDMLMICSHLTDTERARALAQSIINGVDSGKLDPAVLAASRQRVHAMLDSTAQNEVSELSGEVLASHRAAGTQFDAATVEVV